MDYQLSHFNQQPLDCLHDFLRHFEVKLKHNSKDSNSEDQRTLVHLLLDSSRLECPKRVPCVGDESIGKALCYDIETLTRIPMYQDTDVRVVEGIRNRL